MEEHVATSHLRLIEAPVPSVREAVINVPNEQFKLTVATEPVAKSSAAAGAGSPGGKAKKGTKAAKTP